MENIRWVNTIILISWQKIAPLILINFIIVNWIFYCSIILSSIISTIRVLNTTSLRKIIAYSSINHLRWIIIAILSSETIFFIYFIFYSFLSLTIIINFKLLNLFYLNQIFYLFNFKWVNIYFSINILSLGGLPPLTGFIPKIIVINTSIFHLHILLPLLVIIFTLIILFTYLQISFSSLILNYWINNSYQINTNKIKFNIYNKINYISFIRFTINALLILFILSFSINTIC